MSRVAHVVLVTWKSGSNAAGRESVRSSIRGLGETISGIVSIVEGPSSSPEGLEEGLDYGFVITFEDADARDSYLPNPHHRVVASAIGGIAQRVVVFDI